MKYLEEHPTAREGVDWFAGFVWGLLLSALLLGSVWGHARVSAQVLGEGPVIAPTPIMVIPAPDLRLYVPDTYLPYAGKGE